MRKIIIVQSIPEWITIFRNLISKYIPWVVNDVSYTDSFDHALDIVPPDGELIVITSGMFHDKMSEHRDNVIQKIPDNEKNGNQLAKMIKEINPNAKIFLYSEYPLFENDYLDGTLKKTVSEDQNILLVLRLLSGDFK